MNIGFDLDKVFVNTPPFIPYKIIEMLYRKKISKSALEYRIPGNLEQKIRIFSHHSQFRPPILKNISFLKKYTRRKNNSFYLISSRFSFLREKTDIILKRYKLKDYFKNLYFNYQDKQPHEFKNEMITKLNIHRFIDDDLPLLEFLSHKHPKRKFFWLNNHQDKILRKNLIAITRISKIF